MKFPIKDFFRKFVQIRRKLWIWSHLLKKCLIENFIFVQSNYLITASVTWVVALKIFWITTSQTKFFHGYIKCT